MTDEEEQALRESTRKALEDAANKSWSYHGEARAASDQPAGQEQAGKKGLQKFSDVAVGGGCPKCGNGSIKNANPVSGNLAVGVTAMVLTGGIFGVSRKKVRCAACGTKFLRG